MMNRELLNQLNSKYAQEHMDLMQALYIWNEARLSPNDIRDQVRNDIGRKITSAEAVELYHMGASIKSDYDTLVKPYEVSKGRDDLIPDNIKNKSIKMSPSIRVSMERIGSNLFRDKKAKTYWTMKEKIGDNGEKSIFLVAIDEPDDEKKKTASVKQAADLPTTPNQGTSQLGEVGQGVPGEQPQATPEQGTQQGKTPPPNIDVPMAYALSQTIKGLKDKFPPDQLMQLAPVQKLLEMTQTPDIDSALRVSDENFQKAQTEQSTKPAQTGTPELPSQEQAGTQPVQPDQTATQNVGTEPQQESGTVPDEKKQ
jgi:hypothetical protein